MDKLSVVRKRQLLAYIQTWIVANMIKLHFCEANGPFSQATLLQEWSWLVKRRGRKNKKNYVQEVQKMLSAKEARRIKYMYHLLVTEI